MEDSNDIDPPKLRKAHPSAGFTLAELLIVLIILGLLAAIVVPRLMGSVLGGANTRAAQTQIASFAATLDLFRLAVGRYPTADEGLQALIERPSSLDRWSGPYLNKTQLPVDPWGGSYVYESLDGGTNFRVSSLGADRKEGGEGEDADIVSDK